MQPNSEYTVRLDKGTPWKVQAFDSAEAVHRVLRRRFGFRTRLVKDKVVRVGRHARTRQVLHTLQSIEVKQVEE